MKKKSIIFNDDGFALVTTMLLGLLSLALITIAFHMVSSSARLGGVNKRYSVELDTAKGISGYIMSEILAANLTCGSASTACNATTNSQIALAPNICTALNKTGCAGITATYLSETSFLDLSTPPAPGAFSPRHNFYSVRVTSINNSGEQAILDFVYKVVD